LKLADLLFTFALIASLPTLIAWGVIKYLEKAEKTDREFWED